MVLNLSTGELLWNQSLFCTGVGFASVAAPSPGAAPSLIVLCSVIGRATLTVYDLQTGEQRAPQFITSLAFNAVASVNQTVFLCDSSGGVHRWEPYANATALLTPPLTGVGSFAGNNLAIDADGTLLTGDAYLTCNRGVQREVLTIVLSTLGGVAALAFIALIVLHVFCCRPKKQYEVIN